MRVIIVPIMFCLLLLSCGQQERQPELDIAAPVTVEEVTFKPIEEYITSTGTINATRVAEVVSEAAGFYHRGINPRTNRPFAVGDAVRKDEVLVTLENPEYENNVKIDSQKMSLDLSKSEFEKQQSLYDKGGVTLRELKNAEKSYIDAQYSHENALYQLAKLKVVVPLDGIITSITDHTPGVKINSGETIAQIMDYRRLTMDANLPEKQLGNIRGGQVARITSINLPGKVFTGRITQVSPSIDATTRTFTATIEAENPGQELKPGMFVKAEIVVDSRESAVVIPKDVILSRRDNRVVFVVERGLAAERRIVTGLENPDEVEVVEGLAAEDRLVIKGFETLRDRARVKVTE